MIDNKVGWIYVIVDMTHKSNRIRIGRTKNSDMSRVKSQMGYLPFITEFFAFKVHDHIAGEAHLHREFKSKKENGDWYKVNQQQVLEYILDHLSPIEINLPTPFGIIMKQTSASSLTVDEKQMIERNITRLIRSEIPER